MGKYIDADAIKTSVGKLKNTDVNGSAFLCYLILRRHMVLNGGNPQALPIKGSLIKESAFQAALVDPESASAAGFNPLEAKTRSLKWLTSNGPSDTIKNWSTRSAVVTREMEADEVTVDVAPFDADEVKKLLRIQDAKRPDIIDMAIWWYRRNDETELLDDSGQITASALRNQFTQDLNLSDAEVSTLFADPSVYPDDQPIQLSEARPDPQKYLPQAEADNQAKADNPDTGTYELNEYEKGSYEQLNDAVKKSGFIYTSEQVATFLTAVRTKPFVILAGVSGTGKTHLPIILAQSTGSNYKICSVRPDWTDSSPLLGYTDIQNRFHPGTFLLYAQEAMNDPDHEYFFLLDEMNLSRVEYYLSDILSKMETMHVNEETGRLQSEPLMAEAKDKYKRIVLPSNLCLVGSINMDESTQPISKKVLDRAFVLDFNEVDMSAVEKPDSEQTRQLQWNSDEWGANRKPLFGTAGLALDEFKEVTSKLSEINEVMRIGGFNFGYRLRNEICAFIANAKSINSEFTDETTNSSAFDIALKTKVLSRIEGQGITVNDVIKGLRDCLIKNAEGDVIADSLTMYQRTLNKLSDMSAMFDRTGYASYWG